jgi:multimeric flavodoxin WrbA
MAADLIKKTTPTVILALIGSPRKGGNTDLLTDQMIKGAESRGHVCKKLYLYEFDILPCLDCRACKRGSFSCALEDDMQMIYSEIQYADIIIFGTPIYWYGPTAKMKLLIDRLRPFIASGSMEGKKALVVVPSEEGPDGCKPLIDMFRMSFQYLGVELAGTIMAKAYERGEIAGNPEELRRAYNLGFSL